MWLDKLYVFQKERRLLENRRLDLDVCKARLKKAKLAEAKAAVSHVTTCLNFYFFIFGWATLSGFHPLLPPFIQSFAVSPLIKLALFRKPDLH